MLERSHVDSRDYTLYSSGMVGLCGARKSEIVDTPGVCTVLITGNSVVEFQHCLVSAGRTADLQGLTVRSMPAKVWARV